MIFANWHKTPAYLHLWYENCVQLNLELAHAHTKKPKGWSNLIVVVLAVSKSTDEDQKPSFHLLQDWRREVEIYLPFSCACMQCWCAFLLLLFILRLCSAVMCAFFFSLFFSSFIILYILEQWCCWAYCVTSSVDQQRNSTHQFGKVMHFPFQTYSETEHHCTIQKLW